MLRRLEPLALALLDLLTINAAYAVYFWFRVGSGFLLLSGLPDFWLPLAALWLYWLVLFFIVGLYRPWYASSRFDEITLVLKTTFFGCLFLFFAIFVDDEGSAVGVSSRVLIAAYWGILFGLVSSGRLALRSIQRALLIAGYGVHPTLIVGSTARSRDLYRSLCKYPALGYSVVGFVGLDRRRVARPDRNVPLLGAVDDLPKLIADHHVKEVLIAVDSTDHQRVLSIMGKCAKADVALKIMPDLYDVVSGQARTNQIYGFPLIEINPQLLRPWEEVTKRVVDMMIGAAVIILGLPLWLLVALVIKLESRGPVLYRQERVGKDGVHFNIIKFRSMAKDAERNGVQWATKKDPRVTRVGRILRKLHIDEIPQAWNVLKGDMSLVGPRPERPVFVEKLSKEIPLYPRRLKVRPGITGWAQVKHKYDESIEDVRKKVQYDLFYIENMSVRMDAKIILSTLSHMILGKGHT